MPLFTRPQLRVIRHFGENTTMHGIGHITNSRRFARLLWTLLLLVSVSLLFFQIYHLAVKFIGRPVTTKLSVSYETPTTFPTVTLCNLNPLKNKMVKKVASKLREEKQKKARSRRKQKKGKPMLRRKRQTDIGSTEEVPPLSETLIKDETTTEEVYEYDSPPVNVSNENATRDKGTDILIEISEEETDIVGPTMAPNASIDESQMEYVRQQQVMYAMNTINESLRNELSFTLKNLMLRCSFLNRACTEEDFVPISNVRYGRCFQFNGGMSANKSRVPLRKVFTSGTGSSLMMTLFVDQDNYLRDVSSVAGYKVIIHDPSRPPIPEEEGILVMPGQVTNLGAKSVKVTRAVEPYGRCSNFSQKENERINMYLDQLPFTTPNVPVCMRTCEQILVITKCRCYSMELGFANAKAFDGVRETLPFIPPCSTDNDGRDIKCANRIGTQVANGELGCKTKVCRYQSCNHDTYEVSQSHAFWPATNSFNDFENELSEHRKKEFWSKWTSLTDDRKKRLYVSENFLKVKVYLSDLTMVHMKTEPSYQFMDLLSDFGGNAGLWLGLSVFTFFELCVFIVDLLGSMYKTSEEEKQEEAENI